jgi:succinate dehydrogenase / fumarate reductase cytochrome b subunit
MTPTSSSPRAAPALVSAPRLGRLRGATVGLKLLVALSGAALAAFVLVHMSANLLVFRAGGEALDAYAVALRRFPAGLWAVRLGLLGCAIVHVAATVTLIRRNRAARPTRYRVRSHGASTLASRAMWLTGPLLLVFVVYHLLHMTFGAVHPDFRHFEVVRDAAGGEFLVAGTHHNLVTGMRPPAVAAFYLLALAALGLHLHHGVWSLFLTLGFDPPGEGSAARRAATIFALVVCLGFALVPIASLAGRLE